MGEKKELKKAKNRLVDIQPFGVDLCARPITGKKFTVMKSHAADDKGVLLQKSDAAPPAKDSAESDSTITVSDERVAAVGESLASVSGGDQPLTDAAKDELRELLRQGLSALGEKQSDGDDSNAPPKNEDEKPALDKPDTQPPAKEQAASEPPATTDESSAAVEDAPPAKSPVEDKAQAELSADKEGDGIGDVLDGVDLESSEVAEFLGQRVEHHRSGKLQMQEQR